LISEAGNHLAISDLISTESTMRRLWTPLAYVAAAIYFIADVLLLGLVRPISRWFAAHFPMPKVRAWIRSLPPYPCLALFSVPVILLEPVKMIAAYMAATGQVISAAVTFVVGELLKLVLVERLFDLTKTKLMKIPAFAWAYNHYTRAKAWVKGSEAWRVVRSLGLSIRDHYREWRHSGPRHLAASGVKNRQANKRF
jgi:hypothetical protein